MQGMEGGIGQWGQCLEEIRSLTRQSLVFTHYRLHTGDQQGTSLQTDSLEKSEDAGLHSSQKLFSWQVTDE